MRYLKGSKVEVLNTMDPTSSESWRPAEIVSGNGHTYRVIYDGQSLDSWAPVRVLRKDIRPCPPLVVGLRTWSEGDHVEVFEGNSWKPGVVARKDGSYFLVTILGCSREFKAHGCDVRVRQTWQDGQWIMTDKVDRNSDVQVIDNLAKLRNYFLQNQESCRGVKKRTGRKMRAIGDNERVQRRNVKAPYPIPEKEKQVDCDLHIRDNTSQVLCQFYSLMVNKSSLEHEVAPIRASLWHTIWNEIKLGRSLWQRFRLNRVVASAHEVSHFRVCLAKRAMILRV